MQLLDSGSSLFHDSVIRTTNENFFTSLLACGAIKAPCGSTAYLVLAISMPFVVLNMFSLTPYYAAYELLKGLSGEI